MPADPQDDDPHTRILLEVTSNDEHPEHDTPALAAYRAQVRIEVAEIRAKGGIVEIPSEWP